MTQHGPARGLAAGRATRPLWLVAGACLALLGMIGCGGGGSGLPGAGSTGDRAWAEIPNGFDFLPPLHAQKTTDGFNAAARPVIEIWTGTEAAKTADPASAALIQRFAADDITVQAGYFQVNWDTHAPTGGLPSGATSCVIEAYWVEANGCDLLGYVDCVIDKAQGKGKKATDPDYSFALQDGRRLPIKFVIDSTVPAPVPLTVTSVTPASGQPSQTVQVTIAGTGFRSSAVVEVSGGGVTSNVTSVAPTGLGATFTISADAALTLRDVTVSQGHGCTATLEDGFAVTAGGGGGSGLADTPWPKYRHDAQCTGRGGGSGALGNVRWVRSIGSAINSSPAIGSDGLIYFGGGDGKEYGLDPADGAVRRQYATPGGEIYSSPAIGANGRLYSGARPGVFALDLQSFTSAWDLAYGPAGSSPNIGEDGTVYIQADPYDWSIGGYLLAINGQTGAERWRYAMPAGNASSPSLSADGSIVYFGTQLRIGRVIALNTADGSQQWIVDARSAVPSAVAVGADGTVYFGTGDARVLARNGLTGAPVWSAAVDYPIEAGIASPGLGADGTVYVGDNGGRFYAFDGASGARKWVTTLGGTIWGSPAIAADGAVYIGASNGVFYALDGDTGAVVWTRTLNGPIYASPAIDADGTIYIGTRGGSLYALH